jgi:SAM-dependent methyltransferase
MAKQGEIDYLKNIGEVGVWHAANKPFSDPHCGRYLVELGAVISLLPSPPARLLDLGCGTGWTSVFFAKMGYDVTGVDIAPDMIDHANRNRDREKLDKLRFLVCDYEELRFQSEFDGAVFYDSLHHAVDEAVAIRQAFAALKPGGACVASEPGRGHQDAPETAEVVRKFNVTEKDMPPDKVIALGRAAGFRSFQVFPHAFEVISYSIFARENLKPCPDPFAGEGRKRPINDPPHPRRPRFWARALARLAGYPSWVAAGRKGLSKMERLHYILENLRNSGVVLMVK